MPVITPSTSASATAATALLQLPWPFTSVDLKGAYRRASLKYHPDKAGAASTATFQQVHAAFELLQSWVNHQEPSCNPTSSRPRVCCTTSLRTANKYHDYTCPFKGGHQCCPVYFFTRSVHEPACDAATPPPPFPSPPPPQQARRDNSTNTTDTGTGTHAEEKQSCCAAFQATSQVHDLHCPSSTTQQDKEEASRSRARADESKNPPPPPLTAACCTFARRTRGLIHTWACARNPTNRRAAAAAAAPASTAEAAAAAAAGGWDHQGEQRQREDGGGEKSATVAAAAAAETKREEREWRRQREAVWRSWSPRLS